MACVTRTIYANEQLDVTAEQFEFCRLVLQLCVICHMPSSEELLRYFPGFAHW